MLKAIYYYKDDRNNNPVREFIDSLTLKEQAKIFAYIRELRNQGHNLHRPLAGYLGNGIYELRPKSTRVFYFFYLRDTAVLVHSIRKKTDKVPQEDLNLCIKRKNIAEQQKNLELLEL